MDFFDALYTLLILVIVVVLAYLLSKWLGTRYLAQTKKNSNMKVIERLPLGQNQAVVFVKVGEKAMLLGVTPQHVELLCEMSKEEIPNEEEKTDTSFLNTFNSVLKNKQKSDIDENTPSGEDEIGGK